MAYLYEWVRNIVLYMLMISIFEQVLPGGSYKKYMKVISGFVLVFITIWPLMKISGNEEKLIHFFDIENMRIEEKNTNFESVNFENTQKRDVLEIYRLEIEKEVLAEFNNFSLDAVEVRIELEDDETDTNLGQVKRLEVDVVENIESLENYINQGNINIKDIHIEDIGNHRDDSEIENVKENDFTEYKEKIKEIKYQKEIEEIQGKLAKKLFMQKEDIRIIIH